MFTKSIRDKKPSEKTNYMNMLTKIKDFTAEGRVLRRIRKKSFNNRHYSLKKAERNMPKMSRTIIMGKILYAVPKHTDIASVIA